MKILLSYCALLILVSGCSGEPDSPVIIGNKYFEYAINLDGTNLHFIDKSTGTDHLKKDTVSYCSYVIHEGKKVYPASVKLNGNRLKIGFGESGISAAISIKSKDDNVTMELNSVSKPVESLTFLNIPLSLEGMPYEPFAACALSMNLFTRVRQLPALQTHLSAACYEKFGLKGAKVTLLGVPQSMILPSIREVMTDAEDIPFSDRGGAWAQLQKEGYGSYLMNFGTLTEETVDEWIATVRNLGFNQIDNHGGGAGFFRHGEFDLDKKKWPDGWESFKRINDRLHEAGISSIFHTYAFFIDKSSKYATPVPHEDLGYFSSFTLSAPIDSVSTEIPVKESTENISTTTGFFVRNGVSLRIGSEIIQFSGVTKTPPYKFTGCRRGANGTKRSSHQADEKAFHLREMFGLFLPGPETRLFEELARRTAEIVSQCGFDGIYLDAIDGSDILGGEEDFWYNGTKFIFAIARNLEKPVGMEMSSMSHHWWHYRSRWQAWDKPVRGYKRFFDIHSAAIKSMNVFLPPEPASNEYEHGLWRGHSPLIDNYAALENGGFLLPQHFGWLGLHTWNPPQVETSFPDDVEYLCCKMIGNNAGVSMTGGVEKETLKSNPLLVRLIDIIRQYEELRHENYFNDSVRTLLRQPGKEFTLIKQDDGKWNFKPVKYDRHKIAGINHSTAKWQSVNEFDDQPLKLRIEALMSLKPFDDPANIIIADPAANSEFIYEGAADGVSGGIDAGTDNDRYGSGSFFAQSKGSSPREGSWIKLGKKFDPWIDLSKNQGLGVWINGDGNGELLNLRLESPKHISYGTHGDHFIKIDFKGWKYFELVELESSDYSDYMWPDTTFYVYASYRTSLQFKSIDKLQLWYNGLPANREIRCRVGRVKAIPLVNAAIKNPSIMIGNQEITFPVILESGMYLEFRSADDCKLYGPKGELIQDVKVEGKIPVMKNGINEATFDCRGPAGINPRVQVTLITEGNPLGL